MFLRLGTKGETVAAWQTLLSAVGFPVASDGAFGPMTESATQKFQAKTGAQIDGIVGPETAGKMVELTKDRPAIIRESARAVLSVVAPSEAPGALSPSIETPKPRRWWAWGLGAVAAGTLGYMWWRGE